MKHTSLKHPLATNPFGRKEVHVTCQDPRAQTLESTQIESNELSTPGPGGKAVVTYFDYVTCV